MKIIKVVYDNSTDFILEIIESFKDIAIVEKINASNYKNLKTVRGIQTRFGTKNFPLIIFEDENLEEVAAIWSESNPDWKQKISTTLDDLINN
mgnify:CR=1 FL=1